MWLHFWSNIDNLHFGGGGNKVLCIPHQRANVGAALLKKCQKRFTKECENLFPGLRTSSLKEFAKYYAEETSVGDATPVPHQLDFLEICVDSKMSSPPYRNRDVASLLVQHR